MTSRTALRARTRLTLTACVVMLGAAANAQDVFVDANASGPSDGMSWATAFKSLQAGLDASVLGDEIWVAAGTYRPTRLVVAGDARTATFRIPRGRILLGGFDGTETALSQRAGLFDQTFLDGDIGTLGDRSDNAHRVVSYRQSVFQATLDGFTIQHGNGTNNVSGGFNTGGGLWVFSAPLRVANCTFQRNAAETGGGITAQLAELDLVDCRLLDNVATQDGGGLWSNLSQTRVFQVEFARNRALNRGGAVFVGQHADPLDLVNSLLFANRALRGGACYARSAPGPPVSGVPGRINWDHCTIAFNAAGESGGAIFAASGMIPAESTLRNSIVWGNEAPVSANLFGANDAQFCDIEGGAIGAGNIGQDPRFRDPARGHFALGLFSPARNAGNRFLSPPDTLDLDGDGNLVETVPFDLAGNDRDVGVNVDMGAYEAQQ